MSNECLLCKSRIHKNDRLIIIGQDIASLNSRGDFDFLEFTNKMEKYHQSCYDKITQQLIPSDNSKRMAKIVRSLLREVGESISIEDCENFILDRNIKEPAEAIILWIQNRNKF